MAAENLDPMPRPWFVLRFLLALFAGFVNREQAKVVDSCARRTACCGSSSASGASG